MQVRWGRHSQAPTYVVYRLLNNNMPAKLISTLIFLLKNMLKTEKYLSNKYLSVSAVIFCNKFYIYLKVDIYLNECQL